MSNFWSEHSVVERLTISSLGHRGDGVTESGGTTLYVPFTLPGETVEAEPWPGHPDRRALARIETESAERIAPICPHFGVCGGCAMQHWRTDSYLAWKRELVINALRQHGLETVVEDIVDAHGDGRRRAVFHARTHQKDIIEVGYAAARSHRIIAIDHCPILAPSMAGAIDAAWAIAAPLAPFAKPLDIQVTATDSGLDVDVRGSGPLPPAIMSKLAAVARQHRLARLTRHRELLLRLAAPTLRIGPATVELPPACFLQATTAGENRLTALVAQYLPRGQRFADLFCGVGPFALRLAERTQIHAFDSDAAAIAALVQAAKTRGLKPITAVCRDLFRRPLMAQELTPFDAVVFDPPRQGADMQARELAKSRVKTVVSVSCNPGTFARDARILIDGGYRLESVTPVDQFRYSPHVETVARFSR
jgi:23S rRNA (uracil1939-C5)-methyltransferase